MSEKVAKPGHGVHEDRYRWLLIALTLMLVVAPLIRQPFWGLVIQQIFLMGIFISGVLANRRRRRVFRIGIGVAVVAVPLTWLPVFSKMLLSVSAFISSKSCFWERWQQ